MRNENIDMLEDTLRILEQGSYQKNGRTVPLKLSTEEMRESRVLLPREVEAICAATDFQKVFVLGRCGYGCQNKDSFAVARGQYRENSYLFGKDSKPVLVLNLANPVNPGGGVRRGAKAQEEDLCRKSSLLLSLESPEAAVYYKYNRRLHTYMGSHGMIFTPRVEIIRDEKGNLLDDTVIVAVLTCAAPMVRNGKEGMDEAAYQEMVYQRIMGMLKCAGYFGYENLVLGAWGCGAFGNDARVMSDLFYKALKEMYFNGMRAKDFFRRIDFAVLDRTETQYNFREFYRNFSFDNFYRDENQRENEEIIEKKREQAAFLDKIRGSLFGGAVGDALGYPIEFWSDDLIFSRYGARGIQEYALDRKSGMALISDDTQMTLFTANGILIADTRAAMRGIGGIPHDYVAGSYMDWLITQEQSYSRARELPRGAMEGRISWLLDVPELYSRRAPGNTCLSALYQMKDGGASGSIAFPLNNSKGCGGVMRVAPLALRYSGVAPDKLDREGAEIAAITHGNPLGYMSAAVLVHIINRIVYGKGEMALKEIVLEAMDTVSRVFSGEPYVEALARIVRLAVDLSENGEKDIDNIQRLGEGWVAEETLAIAIYCALKYQNDFSAGITAAVNHRGDSDSTGAVAGNILGALCGYEAIDEKWKRNLELSDVILEMADDLCYGCMMNEYSLYEDPVWIRKYMRMRWREDASADGPKTKFMAVKGDITKDHGVEAIVNAANTSLLGGGGVDGAIHRAAGPELLRECRGLSGCETGKAKITRAYKLPCDYVIHTPGPRWKDGNRREGELLASCYKSCLELAVKHDIRKIAFPSISTGIYHFPLEEAAKIAVKTAKQFAADHPGRIDVIKWVLFDDRTLEAYQKELERWEVSETVSSADFYSINRILQNGGM